MQTTSEYYLLLPPPPERDELLEPELDLEEDVEAFVEVEGFADEEVPLDVFAEGVAA